MEKSERLQLIGSMVEHNSTWPERASKNDCTILYQDKAYLMVIMRDLVAYCRANSITNIAYHHRSNITSEMIIAIPGDISCDRACSYDEATAKKFTDTIFAEDCSAFAKESRCIRIFKEHAIVGIITGAAEAYQRKGCQVLLASNLISAKLDAPQQSIAVSKHFAIMNYGDKPDDQVLAKADEAYAIQSITEGKIKAKKEADKKTKKADSAEEKRVVTVVFKDGCIEMLMLGMNEPYDVHTAVAYAIAQKAFGSKTQYRKAVDRIIDNNKMHAAKKLAAKAKRIAEEAKKAAELAKKQAEEADASKKAEAEHAAKLAEAKAIIAEENANAAKQSSNEAKASKKSKVSKSSQKNSK